MKEVNVDLAGTPGGSTGDGSADRIAVDATAGDDVVAVSGASGAASVTGLHADVNLSGAEAALDTLQVNLGGGNDVFDASGLAADVVQLTVVGGAGADLMGIRQQTSGEQFLQALKGLHIPSRDENLKMLGGAAPGLVLTGRRLMTLMLEAKLLREELQIESVLAPQPLANLPP